MIKEINLRLIPEIASTEERLRQYIIKNLKLKKEELKGWQTIKKSIDARQKQVYINLTLKVFINEPLSELPFTRLHYPKVDKNKKVIIVGAGPGGYFAALRLIELGYCPIVLERGKAVEERKKDIARIPHEQKVNEESNYAFGEGGAGAFSDGKLYTRSKKRGNVAKILNVFCHHGASEKILYEAHPHIGTDKLPMINVKMRETIIKSGGEVHFSTCVTALLYNQQEVIGVKTQKGQQFYGPVILATGHSARDVYRFLHQEDVTLESKGLAIGVRLEHPQHLIDQLQYHNKEGKGKFLPAAEYSFVSQVQERGVYSFCMCPGGFVVPATTGEEQLVVNGMSPANRGSKWSNSGMVVEIRPEDLEGELVDFMCQVYKKGKDDFWNKENPLRMMFFQEVLERLNWEMANKTQQAPAQRMGDFIQNKPSKDLPKSSYNCGLTLSELHRWMPQFIVKRLQQGFISFDKKCKGFLTNDAILIGVESRTSSPVRIPRDRETLQHIHLKGLYPCGEGAGYAGGIVSAAIDGERCAEEVAKWLGNSKY